MQNPATCDHDWTRWKAYHRIGILQPDEHRDYAERTCKNCSVIMTSYHHVCDLGGHQYVGIRALPLPDVLRCMYCSYSKPSEKVTKEELQRAGM